MLRWLTSDSDVPCVFPDSIMDYRHGMCRCNQPPFSTGPSVDRRATKRHPASGGGRLASRPGGGGGGGLTHRPSVRQAAPPPPSGPAPPGQPRVTAATTYAIPTGPARAVSPRATRRSSRRTRPAAGRPPQPGHALAAHNRTSGGDDSFMRTPDAGVAG